MCSSFWHIILSSLHFGCTQSAAKLWSWRRSWPILLSSRARAPSWARDWAQVSTLSRAALTSSAVRCPPTGRSLTARSLTANVLANSRKRDWKNKSSNLNYLYNWGRCIQTPPSQRSTDPKPVCHFDPQLMQIHVSYRAFG